MFSVPETAFSIDMDRVRLRPIKLITYFHGSRALRWPNTERSPRTLSKGNKNAREKNSIQLWQNIRYNPSPPFNNPHTYPLFPTIMSDSPADDAFDDHKLPDELEGGAQLAGNSDNGRSPSPFLLSRDSSCTTTIDNARLFVQFLVLTIAFCSSFRPRNHTSETRSRSSQGQQEQEERCGHSRLPVRSCPSGWREEEKGETS